MGFLSKLFGKGSSIKKYEDIFLTGHYKVGQSTEYAFKMAVDAGVKDGVWQSASAGAEALYQAVVGKLEDPNDKPDLDKAKNRIK